MKCATYAGPLRWSMKIWRAAANLKKIRTLRALGTLVLALERIAAMDLRQTASQAAGVEVQPLLDELRIVIESSLRDAGMTQPLGDRRRSACRVGRPPEPDAGLPQPDQEQRARHGGTRAEGTDRERQTRGPGCRHSLPRYRGRSRHTRSGSSTLSRQDAQSTGLGLYLSRAFMRSFKGDLHYEPETGGSTFVVELSPALRESKNDSYEQRNSHIADRRSQPVPREPQPASSDRV